MNPAKAVFVSASLVMTRTTFQQTLRQWIQSLGLSLCLSFLFLGLGNSLAIAAPTEITIEWLQFEVPESEQALFIEKEYEIWGAVDRRSPDYLGKEMWQDTQQPNRLTMINRWAGSEYKRDITKEMERQAEKDFEKAVGKNYPIVESKTFRLRN